MAKQTKPQDIDLGGLPPELIVDGQVLGVDLSHGIELDKTGDLDGLISVVVLKGNLVRHDGMDYAESVSFSLDAKDAERLISFGVVADVAFLHKQAIASDGPTITVVDGIQVNRGP